MRYLVFVNHWVKELFPDGRLAEAMQCAAEHGGRVYDWWEKKYLSDWRDALPPPERESAEEPDPFA
jgi:hypothetical protein